MDDIDIKGIDKAALLAALYNNSRPVGLGILNFDPNPMTKEEASEIIKKSGLWFDYLKGRVIKINLEGDTINKWGYDRDNGTGSAAKVIEEVKASIKGNR
jgi:hypothetical protein